MVKITAKLIGVKFQKLRGDNTDIKAWDEFSPAEQSWLLGETQLRQDEVPVIATTQGPAPLVITTAQIFWRSQEVLHSLALDQIVAVKAPQIMNLSKLDVTELELTDVAGEKHLLRTKPGKPLFIIWNVLLKVGRILQP